MKILSIDPGLENLGYAVLEKDNENFKIYTYDTISNQFKLKLLSQKLYYIHKEILKLIDKYNPDSVAIEKIIYKHTQSSLILAKVQGVLIYTCQSKMKPMYEYTPLEIKKWITGYGHSKKEAIKKMVKLILSIQTEDSKTTDTFDALAIGLCHLMHYSSIKKFNLENKNLI